MSKNKSKSNVALLTEGQSYIQRAKKERREQVESIKFDDDARREWLTGFSKRKKAKIEEKRSRAKERDHQAHLDERRKARQELKERAIENEKSVRTAMGLEDLEDGSDDGDDSEPEAGPSKTQTTEYDDEDGLVTVTITDDWDPSAEQTKRYRSTSADSDVEGGEEPEAKKRVVPLMPASSKRAKDKAKAAKKKDDITKSRSMETKAERKKGRALELTRRVGKAGRAMERDGKQRGIKGGRGRGGAARGGARGGGSGGRGGKGKKYASIT